MSCIGVRNIPTRVTSRPSIPAFRIKSTLNRSTNLIHVQTRNTNRISKEHQLPSILLTNVCSLPAKIEELSVTLKFRHVDVVAITESWLHNGIDNSFLNIPNFNFFRKDRLEGRGGGVCVYISQSIPCKRRLDLENNNFECM